MSFLTVPDDQRSRADRQSLATSRDGCPDPARRSVGLLHNEPRARWPSRAAIRFSLNLIQGPSNVSATPIALRLDSHAVSCSNSIARAAARDELRQKTLAEMSACRGADSVSLDGARTPSSIMPKTDPATNPVCVPSIEDQELRVHSRCIPLCREDGARHAIIRSGPRTRIPSISLKRP